ncbi:MAG: HTH-type transcriptional regulator EthR [Deltaproteobacteria bacterium ADurb.BinA179]|nr:MAG: HTH-type transcriptional regulator EthR [Deltaproteobacteria bacterium ADurb.BinA179]HOD70082.1 TetR/AcrR family transcriptional regulator [Deltaproteobacteria bacterium]HPV29808.1 TetR/AcrR family transcriptional regulator [Deltaproteobacteria bacterium]HQM19403.1 TetR/AcrR family transcriptional regulator [Deltaproteobacteria bacterium]HQO82029.1 TetR/AcrR family transcriptional regulator [Deltaproteobacteria bacterium]
MARKPVREERKKQIFRALDQCLLEKSFQQTSIKDISRLAGVNHGVLHYYFTSKEDVLLQYIDYVVENFKSQMQELMNSENVSRMSQRDFIKEVFRFVNDRITLNRDLSKIFIEIWEIGVHNEAVRDKLRNTYLEWTQTLARNIAGGSTDSETASIMSIAMVAFWEGMALFSTIFRNGEIRLEEVLGRFQQRILEIL